MDYGDYECFARLGQTSRFPVTNYSHSSIWVLLILINLAAAISIVVTVFRVIFYISCAKIQNKIEIQWYEPIQFAFFIENMYSISKRTVLLMDFHYSMLLRVSVCYTLQYINNGKYLSKTEWILNIHVRRAIEYSHVWLRLLPIMR